MSVSREDVINELQACAGHVIADEAVVLECTLALNTARLDLQDVEDGVLLADPPLLTGKNAETRAAEMRVYTREATGRVVACEVALLRAKSSLASAQTAFSSARACARLLAGTEQ